MAGLVGPLVFVACGAGFVAAVMLWAFPPKPAPEPWKPCLMKGAAWAAA